jgi:CHASE2 domain-containing sensor protein
MIEFTLKCSDFHDSKATASKATMEFTALFLAAAVAMLVAWRGSRTLAIALTAATLAAFVATYLHHATDVLKLSF